MRLSRSKEWKVNMGNYEHMQVSSMVTVDILDLYTPEEAAEMDPDEQIEELRAFAERHLEQQLEPELKMAAKLSQAKESILPEPEPEPRRERVKRRSTT